MNKKQQIYIVVNKETNEKEMMLIGNWYLVPMFIYKKSAIEFMKGQMLSEDLKVIKCKLYE